MKTNKTPTKTRVAKTATKDKPTTSATSAPASAARTIKGTSSPATARKSPTASAKTAKSPAPLTSPRVTKAAANAKRALTLAPEVVKPPKPAAAKKTPKATAGVKPVIGDAPTSAIRKIKEPATSTTIEAFIDVGFGNRLTLRGEGAGLSWERGLTMNCLGSAEWVITLEGETDAPLTFKFLLNDERWSLGENYTLAPGKTGAFTPEF